MNDFDGKTAWFTGGGSGIGEAAAKALAARGANVLVTDINGDQALRVYPGRCAYAASKNALHGIAKAAAVDLLPFGIRVNVLAPGVVATEGFRNSMQRDKNLDPKAENLLKDAATTESIADTICFFLSDASGAATSQLLPIDNGLGITMYNSALHEHYDILAKLKDY